MRLVFIHQNLPGQFRHMARALAAQGGYDMVFIGTRTDRQIPGARVMPYRLHRTVTKGIHPYLVRAENAVLHGQGAARQLVTLRDGGFRPDLIIAHSGWGEALFIKDVFPSVPLLIYSEFYYTARGTDVGFEAPEALTLDAAARTRMRATHILQSLVACDRALTPTAWQKSVHPPLFHPRIDVIHEGVDTGVMTPDPTATVTLGDGMTLRAQDEVITYVARNLEPYRGFHIVMRALPAILEARPAARVVIVGGDDVSYGQAPGDGRTWRETLLSEVPLPADRVIFTGQVPYDTFRRILQVSSVHVYLTYPFVLSWSMLEAMSCGCLVVGSDTPPVREVVTHGETGLLTSFHDPDALAAMVIDALARSAQLTPVRAAARHTIIDRYDRPTCLRQQLDLIGRMAQRAL
ncbi:glycosyltransferase [Roseospira marina]|uniref:Glycosyltransferase n=1 Tax=Roseospira marina TaxID=140057 RepID=A0A5M6ID48_9PROT|nr:glycosyltransferase family 4 protein [Roseospira marina]KAA5606153.1 glycosyltransferase [Roseospira marina]MBB4314292.1 glycosyltransferase involved in cell wall biosynthesis [Roseospira marina]MBB5087452.1 glycosyltransferase involved in cell wall biosynthesis [Roseospira marina]